ncbi:MAG: nuclease-related domain-containing protein [Pseudomonadota bacterium]|nr:nuclease-related domain-containing protein [Pseudomonadota bacterium]
MLIKSADDKSKRVALLQSLQADSSLDRRQQDWVTGELWRLRQGIQGERDASHYIDSHFRDNENYAIVHDLRVVVDGEVAQIDHLLIGRTICFLFETKCFGGNLKINDHGEFSVTYAGRRTFGIESPIEQSRRHEKTLRKLLDRLDLKTRTGLPIEFRHVVLVHPKATITRPSVGKFNTSNVIKADQLPSWHARFVEEDLSVIKMLSLVMNVRGTDTVRAWAEKIVRQHRPSDLLALPEFLQSALHQEKSVEASSTTRPTLAQPVASVQGAAVSDAPKRLVCMTCGVKISYPEGKFCWNNVHRFGGGQYCREHQAAFK